jgi:predicted nucleic acid-binding protein
MSWRLLRLIIVDASVLIHLARANSFSLLNLLYENLVIAPGVYVEVVERGWGLPGSLETENAIKAGWLEVQGVENKARVLELIQTYAISLGNAETVQLASSGKRHWFSSMKSSSGIYWNPGRSQSEGVSEQ